MYILLVFQKLLNHLSIEAGLQEMVNALCFDFLDNLLLERSEFMIVFDVLKI